MSKFIKLLTAEILRTVAAILSLAIFANIIVNGAWTYLFPDSDLVREFDVTSLKFLLLIALLVATLGWAVSYLIKVAHVVSLRFHPKGDLFTYFVTALFLAVFFNQTTSALIAHRPYSVFFLTIVFLFLLPQLVNFYATFNLARWKLVLTEGKTLWQQERANIAKIKPYHLMTVSIKLFSFIGKVAAVLIVLLTLSISSIVLIVNYLDHLEYQKTTQGMFYIKQIIPNKTIYGGKVELIGYNFGIKTEGYHYKIMSSYGEIGIHEWTQNKISFIVPLHLKETSMYVWLERPQENRANSPIIKTNEIIFTVIPRKGFYPDSMDDPKWKRGLKRLKRFVFIEKGLLYKLP